MIPPFAFIPNKPAPGDIVFENVIWRSLANGKLLWEVYMKDVSMNNRTQTAIGIDKAELKDGDKTELTVRAGEMVRNNKNGDIKITNGVTVDGKDIFLSTKNVEWVDSLSVLRFNESVAGQLGDISVTAAGGEFYVLKSTMRFNNRLTISTQGNTLVSQNGGEVKTDGTSFKLNGPTTANLSVKSLEEWSGKNNLPKIPEIPKKIKESYGGYLSKKQ